jgi:hypothetical protein
VKSKKVLGGFVVVGCCLSIFSGQASAAAVGFAGFLCNPRPPLCSLPQEVHFGKGSSEELSIRQPIAAGGQTGDRPARRSAGHPERRNLVHEGQLAAEPSDGASLGSALIR